MSRHSARPSIASKLIELDSFGTRVEFNFGRRSKVFKTRLGATISVFIYILMAIYGMKRFYKFYTRNDTIIFESIQNNYLHEDYEFNGRMGLQLAVGISDYVGG